MTYEPNPYNRYPFDLQRWHLFGKLPLVIVDLRRPPNFQFCVVGILVPNSLTSDTRKFYTVR